MPLKVRDFIEQINELGEEWLDAFICFPNLEYSDSWLMVQDKVRAHVKKGAIIDDKYIHLEAL